MMPRPIVSSFRQTVDREQTMERQRNPFHTNVAKAIPPSTSLDAIADVTFKETSSER